ncbi:HAD family hydrolase [Sphingomonas sp.]|jgi:FMN phosphatase YigB (HAD superfamily)|uniref:HAD family hydrolase n=1 Tax=Sphingomonas sp. TaxID=28214 RepID=UPI002ED82893
MPQTILDRTILDRTILAHQLPGAIDEGVDVAMLSLDCFDTLLWRDTHAPHDLFALLEEVTPAQRSLAEQNARKSRMLAHGKSGETTLREIYNHLLPKADSATIETFVGRELAVEARHCFAFGPTVALMREAKDRGMRVVIVSDTYLERDQLAWLIRTAAGDDVADLIDAIYCSCEHRKAKSEGLFDAVIREARVPTRHILHIGDNPVADLAAATRHGLQARHLVQFTGTSVQRLRQEAAAGAMLCDGDAAFQTHRATLALGEPQIGDEAEAMGFATLGPVLTGFAHWLRDEAAALAATRPGAVHMLFLLRDGYLPQRAFEAAVPGVVTHAVEISRFTSTAASLHDAAAIRRYVLDNLDDRSGTAFLRQLLLKDDEIGRLLGGLPTRGRAQALAQRLAADRWTTRIVARSKDFADRMIAYLRAMVDPRPGDTLMLVDLGYNGSVQNCIDPLLGDAFGVHIAGRYLMLSETLPSTFDKRGMIDERSHDLQARAALMGSIAVLEQLCTVTQGSVVDYDPVGIPVRAAIGIKARQSDVRERIQTGCVRFARESDDAVIRRTTPAAIHQSAAAAALARLLFLPLPYELALLARFEHDVNLGTDATVSLFDPTIAARGLRERGLFYMKGAERMYLPAELRGQGLPTSLALLAQRRFGLDLRYADFCDREIALPLLVVDGRDAFTDTVSAMPTHDGYHVAAIPVGESRYSIGVQFGRLYEWLQIDSARFLPVTDFLAGEADPKTRTFPALPSCEGMEQVAPHIFQCADENGFLMIPPPTEAPSGVPMMLAIVFRPLVEREAADTIAPSPVSHLIEAHQ